MDKCCFCVLQIWTKNGQYDESVKTRYKICEIYERSVLIEFLTAKINVYVWDEINHHFSFAMTYAVLWQISHSVAK